MNKSIDKNNLSLANTCRHMLAACALVLSIAQPALADYVGESQTTKYLDPATQAMLAARYQSGGGGLQVGDEISYVIQFTPVPGGTTELVGGGAYVTDYIPAGTQVVNAQFVQDNGNGTYTQISPPPPAEVRAIFVPQYSETGIFYSSDPRTAMYTNNASPSITATNGYAGPAGGPVGGYSIHNAWDAAMFPLYTTNPATTTTCTAVVANPVVASPVAGPDSYIKNDSTGGQGPWHRIAYPGSTIATAAGVVGASGGCIGGAPTSIGYQVSSANPLPSSVNAIRFAGGQTTVGQLFSVRITLRVTQPVSASGIINNSEVFGGDVSILNTGLNASKSNIWRYVFPSVANASTTLIVLKRIIGMCAPVAPATTCVIQPYTGGSVPSVANLNLRYEVSYLNGSGGVQTNVLLSDAMPTGGTLLAGSATVVSGANILPTVAVSAPVGFNFAPLATLGSGAGGTVQFTAVFTTAPPKGVALSNTIKLTSSTVASGVTSTATTTPTTLASLTIDKTTPTPSVLPSGAASYVIRIPNNGLGIASAISVVDTLPSDGLSTAIFDRFSYLLNSVVATITNALGVTTAVTPVTAIVTAPTVAPFREKVTFTLPASATLASGSVLNISFGATVGSNVPATATPYLNDAQASYIGGTTTVGGTTTTMSNGVAPVTVSVPMTLTKSIDCVYSGVTCVPYSYGASIPTASKIKYRLTYTNTSAAVIAGVVLNDTLPLNTTFVAATAAEVTGTGYTTFGTVVQPTVAAQVLTFGTIASLPAGATGAVTFDVQLGAAALIPSGTFITNNAKINSTLYAGGVTASLTTGVLDQANLVITKTATSSVLPVNGTAAYTITVTNAGNVAASGIKVYDALPFASSVVNANTRFNYLATSAFVPPPASSTLTAPVVASTVGATNTVPYNVNLNQQQVSWTFTASQVLAPGASFNISFTAAAGAASGIPASNTVYYNSAQVNYASGIRANADNTAPVTIPVPPANLTVSKTINCVYNTALTACIPYNGTGIIPANAKVRYQIHYQNTAATAQTNVYICDQISSSTAVPVFAATLTMPVTLAASGVPLSVNTAAPNGPPAGAVANPANALCALPVLAGSVSFSFPAIPSLAAGASGDVFVDAATNVATTATLSNTAKLVSAQSTAGQTSTISAVALNAPSLLVSKTTSTPTLAASGVASYTISVTNTGSAATTGLKIYDFLPYSGTIVDATKRFTYTVTSSSTKTASGVVSTTVPVVTPVSPPTIAPYNANVNQQQVMWDFGTTAANQLNPGDTMTIAFNAAAGSAMPVGNYNNSVGYEFASASGPGSNNMNGLATVTAVSLPNLTIKKVVSPFSDPINGTTNPLFIPGGVAQYTVTVSNAGGPVDNNTVFITDAVPTNTTMYVKDLGVAGSGSIAFNQGTPASGLTYTPGANISYFGVTPPATVAAWGYVPVPGANGCDPNVQQFKINPQGIFVGSATLPSPSFNYNFRVCLQ
ncbi:MAG: hypothetical protein WCD45_07245 [Gallionella sp.]